MKLSMNINTKGLPKQLIASKADHISAFCMLKCNHLLQLSLIYARILRMYLLYHLCRFYLSVNVYIAL